jgi:hypothetical protein
MPAIRDSAFPHLERGGEDFSKGKKAANFSLRFSTELVLKIPPKRLSPFHRHFDDKARPPRGILLHPDVSVVIRNDGVNDR